MALQKTASTVFGVEVSNAYHRVENAMLNSTTSMTFCVRTYVDSSKPFFAEKTITCSYNIDGENPIKQAYEHLKTLDDYSDATDV